MTKNILFMPILIIIDIIILILLSATIIIYPKSETHASFEVSDGSTGVKHPLPISGESAVRDLLVVPSRQAQKVIGHIGSNQAIFDSGLRNLKRLINQTNSSFSRFGHSVLMRWGQMAQGLYQSKIALGKILEGFLPISIANLLTGMVFGGSKNIPDELSHSLKVTGMLHVVSASGYNVGLIYGIAETFWRRFWPSRMASIFTIGLIFGYVYLADATPSVVRAGCMLSLQVGGRSIFNRQVQILWLLGITAIFMSVIWPSYLESLSFQFSVLACLGILIWSSVLGKAEWYTLSSGQPTRVGVKAFLLESLWLTLAAQSFTWGVQIANFNEISLISLVANPAAIWLTPWLTKGTLLFLGVGVFLKQIPVVREFALPLLSVPLLIGGKVFIWIINLLGRWEWGLVTFNPQPRWFSLAWCLGVLGVAFLVKKIKTRRETEVYVT